MEPFTIGMTIGGAILGKIGMRKRRREERKRRKAEKRLGLQAQKSLIGSISGLREEYQERAGFARQEFGLRQQSALQGYGIERESVDELIGSTGLAYGAGAENKGNSVDEAFGNQLKAERLAATERMSSLSRGFEGELRDTQVGLLNLERTASERGYSLPKMGANFNTNPSGLGGIV